MKGTMKLSGSGLVALECWRTISAHFPLVRSGPFQVMPNHLHGILTIEDSCRGEVTSPLQRITLGRVVAYFKYQTTKYVNLTNKTPGARIFQRNYYDHIIRSDREYYFIERYIELNPLLWHLDSDNRNAHLLNTDDLERTLKEDHGLDDSAIMYILEHERNYSADNGR